MELDQVEQVLEKIGPFTDYVYLHVKGEPLLHPKLKEILALCQKYHLQVNITTNATLLKKCAQVLAQSGVVRQLNLSLHSEHEQEHYLEDIFAVIPQLSEAMAINYRFWTTQQFAFDAQSTEMVEKLIAFYHLSPEIVEKVHNEAKMTIAPHTYIHKSSEFLWPDLENDYCEDQGYCYALKDHIAILVDGTIVPCCLDGEGKINLGNIFRDDLSSVLEQERVLAMRDGFCQRKVTEELCKHCDFKSRF